MTEENTVPTEVIEDGVAPAILLNDEGEIDGFGECHPPVEEETTEEEAK